MNIGLGYKLSRIEFFYSNEGRYGRQELASWWDQKKVSSARVIVAGAGALGNEVIKLLALIGVGQITVIDFDKISPSNLARMVLFRESDVGRSKVQVVAERISEINPGVNVVAIEDDLRFGIGLGEYRSADLVFGCLDSINARWALNRKCMRAGVDWIDGGISDFHGLVARYGPKDGACYECNFTSKTIERFNQRYSCPYGFVNDLEDEKVPTTAVTTSAIAAIQVQQGLLMLHDNDQALKRGERATLFLMPFFMNKDVLPLNPECLAHDLLPETIHSSSYSQGITVNEAIEAAKRILPSLKTLSLPFELVVEFYCSQCEQTENVLKPKEKVFQNQSKCDKCGQLRDPKIISTINESSELAELTFEQLGIPEKEILRIDGQNEEIFIQFG